MGMWDRVTREQRKAMQLLNSEKMQLLQEIEKARLDWVTAQHRLDIVIEHDQIDYAIYALEASQKRLDMLFKQAKRMKLSAWDVRNSKNEIVTFK
ncbi:DUF2508 family protein [Paenibacillus sp. FSL H7-0331]|uniref:DUF2508 family protein n=1 Tax=Paenibacillus sp. FSL H7-0331 TaxID=1920421 RepID=UPI00096F9065|nr:DUF2508 family protein [Paenibacillus sp. FSL H7-0331]OMF03559.1 hypothetical protein BK127_35515 [Paenibacillus sp. FSL H7-0331]